MKPAAAFDWDQAVFDLEPIQCDRDFAVRKRRSRDYYWFSPILKTQLEAVQADIVVTPTNVSELERVLAYAAAHRLPITPRGGGTGNYGQAMPLHGGILLDLGKLARVLWVNDEAIRAEAGTRLIDLERAANKIGRELRFHPSTWKKATVGGFVAGGSTGCGAINHGTLHSAGNVRALRVMTMEQYPRLIDLRGAETGALIHAYGTTGIIVEVEFALAPARQWHDRIVALKTLDTALQLIDHIARDDAIGKKELALFDANAVALLKPLTACTGIDEVLIVAMIEESSLPRWDETVARFGGAVRLAREPDSPPGQIPALYELCWNHTTLHAIGADPTVSYLQIGFPKDYITAVLSIAAELGNETPMHLELLRTEDGIECLGLPLLRYTNEIRLAKVCEIFKSHGCVLYDPHTYLLETAGMPVDPAQVAFRRIGDPFGLLNPGKILPLAVPSIASAQYHNCRSSTH
jgi:FAD/FMN-containing dehydrogenase